MNYIARELAKVDTKPGCWNYLNIGVFEVADDGTETQVGSYERKYSSMYDTFCAFKQKGKWYALYSSDYTCTSVMSLPDCKQIATEPGSSSGFCPTGFYVPNKEDLSHWDSLRIHQGKRQSEDDEYWDKLAVTLKSHEEEDSTYNAVEDAKKKRQWAREEEDYYADIENNTVGQFGFVCGCVWGDDSSWKLEYLDLSKITEGIIKREQRFGYHELPNLSLKECLDFEEFNGPSFTQFKALKSVTLPLLDRNWSNQEVGQTWQFADDSVFNGLTVKIKEWSVEGCVCDIVESKNPVKDKEIYLEEYLFKYAKKISPTSKEA